MACSPQDVQPVLDYEAEESAIIQAVAHRPLDLTVEESGSLQELGLLWQDYPEEFFDVVHITGHAGHGNDGPVFLTEDSEGNRLDVSAADFGKAFSHKPPLLFVSGCQTGQAASHGEIRSLAEQLVGVGFPAVLGWGRPVRDGEATLAAATLYRELAAGEPLAVALVRAHAVMLEANARDWHLLRLYCAGDLPRAFVTRLKTPGRKRPADRAAESEFLDPRTRLTKVATRSAFVGRRRLLQRCIRMLRDSSGAHGALLLRGQGGRGKSSIAARLCERLRRDYERVVLIGRLDEPSFINAWAPDLPDEHSRKKFRDAKVQLELRIREALVELGALGNPAPLFVLDDFERNQPGAGDGNLELTNESARVLKALLGSVNSECGGRVLITCRYALPEVFARLLHAEDVLPLDTEEQRKQNLRLEQNSPNKGCDERLLREAVRVSDGNPRLMAWLHVVLKTPGLDTHAILTAMEEKSEEFRVDILAHRLVASLDEDTRVLLSRMLLLELSVPVEAVAALMPERATTAIVKSLDRAAGLALVDVTDGGEKRHYRVPRQFGGGKGPPMVMPDGADAVKFCGMVFDVLYSVWWTSNDATEARALELIRLGVITGKAAELKVVAAAVARSWLAAHRYADTAIVLSSELLDQAGRPPILLTMSAHAKQVVGEGPEAGRLFEEAFKSASSEPDDDRGAITHFYTDWLSSQGKLDEALRIIRSELQPLYRRLGNERELALAAGQIADILQSRGAFDEALRIRREEELPVYERLGYDRERGVTMGKIADILMSRGEPEEALRIRREVELPIFDALGDIRLRAVTMGRIADILESRGELDEALRIRREEELPIFQRLGDVRNRAMTIGKIADILEARGELEEALRIRREEELPVYVCLQSVRNCAVTMGRIADVLEARGELEEALRIRREEELPVYESLGDERERAVTMGKIAEIRRSRGEIDEALKVLRDDVLPVFERIGETRSRAVTMGRIADILVSRGELDEALRIRREEELPVFERLGDIGMRAATMGKVADILELRGDFDEALRIRREEQLPAYERIGNLRSIIVARVNLALNLIRRGREDDTKEVVENLAWGYLKAARSGYVEAGIITHIFTLLGVEPPSLGKVEKDSGG
jgi:tetratricopeptide (TPR) repeat protein